jgi:GGDEF domain-containing protein
MREKSAAGSPAPECKFRIETRTNSRAVLRGGPFLFLHPANCGRAHSRGAGKCRHGFVVLDSLRSTGHAGHFAESIAGSLAKPFSRDGIQLMINASVGPAPYPVHGTDALALIKKADTAMVQARIGSRGKSKDGGRSLAA